MLVNGNQFYLDPYDELQLGGSGMHSHFLTNTIKNFLRPSDYVLDIGAFTGYFTTLFAHYAHYVYAFEPYKPLYDLLYKNAACYDNISTYNLAVSNVSGKTNLFVKQGFLVDNRLSEVPGREKVEVETIRVDDWNITLPIAFIKVDAQGSEGLIIDGMVELLQSYHPVLVLELSPYHLVHTDIPAEKLLKQLRDLEYKIWNIDQEFWNVHPATDEYLLKRYAVPTCTHTDILCTWEGAPYGDCMVRGL